MSSNDRLNAIKKVLNVLLEGKIGNLLGVVRATQQVTRELIAAEEEIRRQSFVRDQLAAELGPTRGRGDALSPETKDLQARLDRVQENLDRMKSLRDELLTNLGSLQGGLRDA